MFGSSSKKRPNSLVIGRTFDHEVTDMFEWGIENHKFMEDFKVSSFKKREIYREPLGS